MVAIFTDLGWKGGLGVMLALGGLIGGGASAINAHLTPNYGAVVEAAGPIVPGSFRVVAEGQTSAGRLLIYTVARPGREGKGLGALLTRQPNPFARITVDAGESVGVPAGAIRYGVVRLSTANLVYGVTTSGASTLIARTMDGRTTVVAVDPRGGFYLTVPLTSAGATFTPAGP